ncbi:MAG: 3-keto-5-aminohexanoate cleavage protein [Candidatus Lokiarchaeota archaeon]|nr:3-keto-5-aminohexanoate cleavage protein [Candidatus Lokiarchaeota archaeon]MBD3199286.1 3-keto-5-aminohexanoate cleavage protein [Candidatus Lokiarchaeota archaeon]
MEDLIITAAICGAEVTKEHNKAVPYAINEIVNEAEKAYAAGASIIHLHVRQDDGRPTQDLNRFQHVINGIKEVCPDVIIQPSTGGSIGMNIKERIQPIYVNPPPEMATLDCGTMNFGGDDIFINTENDIIYFAEEMIKLDIKPELECFDKGMIDTVLKLHKKGFIKSPMHFNLVLGVIGGISADVRDLVFLIESLPNDATYTVTGIGKYEFNMATASIIMGGHARVGLEDNIYISQGLKAKSNAELVKKIVRIANELGREIATPNKARQILGLV